MLSQQNINSILGLRPLIKDLFGMGRGTSSDDKSDSKEKTVHAEKSGKGQNDEHLFQQACYEAIIKLAKDEDLAPLFESQDQKKRLDNARKMIALVEDVISADLSPKERHLVVLTIGLREQSVVKKIPQTKEAGAKEDPKPIEKSRTANDSGRDILIRLAMEQDRNEIAKRCRLMAASENYQESQWEKWDTNIAEVTKNLNDGIKSIFDGQVIKDLDGNVKEAPLWIDFVPFFRDRLERHYLAKFREEIRQEQIRRSGGTIS